ncbi:MAG: sigma-70 family RNA polymerase sigma factor [Oscillospiraceae bacterium]|nr:sigma-70 family RNA polymerase sigma factor [Oscillospiraceae bacterium]
MQSVEDIYREHSRTVYRFLLSRTGSPDLAEELTQETFYLAVKGIDRFDGSCKISTWLIAIAKNALSSWRRKNPETESLESAQAAGVSSVPDSGEGQVEIMKAIRLLPEETREVMYMRLFGDLSFRQIGEIMEKTESWARVTYFRGREKLKKELEK